MNSNSDIYKDDNPLLSKFDTLHETALFAKIKNEHYIPAFEFAIEIGRKEVESIAGNDYPPDFANTIEALDKAANLLSRVGSIFFNLNHAETSSEMQDIARIVSPLLTDFDNDIIFNKKLFDRIEVVYNQRDNLKLSVEQETLLTKTFLRFFRNGISLDEKSQKRLRAINKELSELSLKFDDNVLAETNDFVLYLTEETDLSGLPEAIIESAAHEAQQKKLKGWVFTLQAPSYLALMKYSDNRILRERMYRAMATRGFNDNDFNNAEIIKKIANLRLEKARLLGYITYAHFVLEQRMAENPENVNYFLNELLAAAKPVALKNVEEVQQTVYEMGADFIIQPWDWLYYSEKLKKKKYDFDEEKLRPYFELNNVKNGVFELAKRLWGLSFKQNIEIEVYHNDVETYEVYDNDGSFLAVLYLDFFPRESKNGGAWMTSYRDQEIFAGKNIRPHISVVCNFSKPTPAKPSLLTFGEFTTFLHEFGHALHGMLSDVNYNSLSGTNVYRDFVELPSQILENWAIEKQYLDIFACHYQTKDSIPKELIDKIIALRNFNSAYNIIRQVGYGINDMAWHSISQPVIEDPKNFENRAMKDVKLLPNVEGTIISTAFSHIFAGGYSAGYYSYKWAEVLDADAFTVFKENGVFDKNTADLFRNHILSKGGSEHPMTLYKRFRGKEPNVEPMLEREGLKLKL